MRERFPIISNICSSHVTGINSLTLPTTDKPLSARLLMFTLLDYKGYFPEYKKDWG